MNQGVEHGIPSTNGVGNGQRKSVGEWLAVWVGMSQRICNSHAAKFQRGSLVDFQSKEKQPSRRRDYDSPS
jgi:hypothetical protein